MVISVFYVDDEVELCETFSEYFSTDQVRVRTFSDPAQCILAAQLDPPDVCFLDYRLPGTTGDQVAQALSKTIPKYLITGDIGVRTDYRFEGVFTKPYKFDELQKVISSFLKVLSA